MSGYSSRATTPGSEDGGSQYALSRNSSRVSSRVGSVTPGYGETETLSSKQPGQYLRNGTRIPDGLLKLTEESAASRENRLLQKIKLLKLENEELHRDLASMKDAQFALQDTKNAVVARDLEIRKLKGDLRGSTRINQNQSKELERLNSQDATVKEMRALKEEVRVLRAQTRAHQERHRKNDELIKQQHHKVVTVNEKCRRLVEFIQDNGIEDPTRSARSARAGNGDSERMRRLEKQVESANRGRDVAERKVRALQNELDKVTQQYEHRLAEKDKELRMHAAEVRKKQAASRHTQPGAIKRKSSTDTGSKASGNPRPPSGPKKGPSAASPKASKTRRESQDKQKAEEAEADKEKSPQEILLEKIAANQERTRKAQALKDKAVNTTLPTARAALDSSDFEAIKEQVEGTAALQVQLLYDRVLILLGRELSEVTITDTDPKTGLVVMPLRIAPSWSQTRELFTSEQEQVITKLKALEPSELSGETMALLDAYDDKVDELNVAKADMAYTASSPVCQVVAALLAYSRASIQLEMLKGEARLLNEQLESMISSTQESIQADKKAEEEEAAKKKAEEEAAAKKAEEEEAAKKKAEEEEAAEKKAQEEEAAAKKKAEEEEAAKKAEEEGAAKKAEEEEAAKKAEEEGAAKKAEEEAAAKKAEEEAAAKKAEEEAAAKTKAEEEEAAKKKSEEEEAAKKAEPAKEEDVAKKAVEEAAAAAVSAEAGEPPSIPPEEKKDSKAPWKRGGGSDSDSDFESFY